MKIRVNMLFTPLLDFNYCKLKQKLSELLNVPQWWVCTQSRLVEHGTHKDIIGSILLTKRMRTHRVIGTPSICVICPIILVV